VVRLEGICTELAGIAAKLDANIADYDSWADLARTIKEGNRVFQAVRYADRPWQNTIFPEMRSVLNKTLETFQIRLDKALNPTVQRGANIRYDTVADAMDLNTLQKSIAYLRRLHIDAPAQVAPAAALEAVLA
jgi:hypothetical protein